MPIYEYVCMSCESHFEELVGMLDPEKDVGEYHFGREVTLFLSLKAGAAGARRAGR